MKRFLSLLLCAILICTLFAGCKNNSDNSDNTTGNGDTVDFGSLSGKDVAKLLLARTRLDPSLLSHDGGLSELAAKHRSDAENDTFEKLSVQYDLLAAGDGTYGFTMTDDRYVWSDFQPDANMVDFFKSYFTNIEYARKTLEYVNLM